MSKVPGLSGTDCLRVRQESSSVSFFHAPVQYPRKRFCLFRISLQTLSVCACPLSSFPSSSPLPVCLNLLVDFLCQISWRAAQHCCEPWEAIWPGGKERGPLSALHNENDRSLNFPQVAE